MKAYLTSRNAAVAAAVGILAALPFSGVAQAITDTVFLYSSPKTGFFSIDPMAMAPSNHTGQYTISVLGAHLTADSNTCFTSGVNLPQAAIITRVLIWYESGSGLAPLALLLRRKFADGTIENIAARTITDNAGIRKSAGLPVTASLAAVNNGQFSYGFAICLASTDNVFAGARIAYTYRTAGD